MAYFPSNLGYIGLASQGSAKTTAKTTSAIFIPFTSEDIAPEFDAETLMEGGQSKYDVLSVKNQTREKVNFGCYARPKASAYYKIFSRNLTLICKGFCIKGCAMRIRH